MAHFHKSNRAAIHVQFGYIASASICSHKDDKKRVVCAKISRQTEYISFQNSLLLCGREHTA
ncbi:hypothetical protein DPMN_158158 [Dreissena polymorpha]|uniref:Uncharacterized protein n=1 Tax=Dreissena polymorpha TaxID=45954 RepID=A0A9D4ELT9_DREPO|nr:hypothetical protein DPMN_158158 [Dreissena polymorpha]